MTDQPQDTPQDDVEAHMPYKYRRDEEAPTDKPTGAEPAADDDVEGHSKRFYAPAEQPPADVEAHMPYRWRRDDEVPTEKPTGARSEADRDDDVEGSRGAGASGEDDVEAHARRS